MVPLFTIKHSLTSIIYSKREECQVEKIIEVINKVIDELGLDRTELETRYTGDGRWLCSDGHIFILASIKHQNIEFWAEMHKKITAVSWQLIQQKGLENLDDKPYPNYKLLARCKREPEVNIILNKHYGEVAVVAYLETTFEIILEQMQFTLPSTST